MPVPLFGDLDNTFMQKHSLALILKAYVYKHFLAKKFATSKLEKDNM